MPLYWLCYRHSNQISVVIEPGASLIHARMRAALADLDQGEFTNSGMGICRSTCWSLTAVASLASGLPLEAILPIRLIRPRSQAASGTEQRVSQ